VRYPWRTAADATFVRRPNFGCTVVVSLHVLTNESRTAHLPEVDNDLVVLRVSAVVGVLLPVVDVDIGNTANEELEFALVENIDQIRGDQLVEAGDEGVELFFDTFLNAPFGDETARSVGSKQLANGVTHSTYSFLFSFVTSISSPPGFNSMLTVSPNRSSSVLKVSSSASVMSLLLRSC
jgi:hypothetical protein